MIKLYLFELKKLLCSLRSNLFIAGMIAIAGIFTTYANFYLCTPNFEYTLSFISVALLFILPLLTFPAFAEEKSDGTYKMYISMGIKNSHYLFAKYLAYVTVFNLSMLVICFIPLLLIPLGKVNLLSAYVGILGYNLFGCALTSVLLFISAVSKNKLVSVAVSYGAVLLMYISEFLLSFADKTPLSALIVSTIVILSLGAAVYFLTKSEYFALTFSGVLILIEVIFRFASPKNFSSAFTFILENIAVRDALSGFLYGFFDFTCIIRYLILFFVFGYLSFVALDNRKYN